MFPPAKPLAIPSRIELVRRIRFALWIFIVGLVLSGATAIPLQTELGLLVGKADPAGPLGRWLLKITSGLVESYGKYPFLAYGTDWLAFGHFVIAVAFIGPLRDPRRNSWVIEFGLIACAAVIPFALVMGQLRGIPLFWRLVDCSFGAGGMIPLLYCKRLLPRLEAAPPEGPRPT
jgi:hypothetical protein